MDHRTHVHGKVACAAGSADVGRHSRRLFLRQVGNAKANDNCTRINRIAYSIISGILADDGIGPPKCSTNI